MKTKICFTLLGLFLNVCSHKWPTQWSNDLKVVIGMRSGKMPGSWRIMVKSDSATYELSEDGKKNTQKFILTAAELDSIANAIRIAKPETIRPIKHSRPAYDKATSYLQIQQGDYKVNIENSATSSLTPEGSEQFGKIFITIRKIVESKAEN